MKTKIFFIALFNLLLTLAPGSLLFSQSINGKLGTGGEFIIRDTNNTFLTLPQNTGFLNLNRSLVIPNTTSSTVGVVFKGADRFLHNFGTNNIFVGLNSGNFTMTGSSNSAFGFQSLSSNTTGGSNSAFGWSSLVSNTTGVNNSAFGFQSLVSNTTGFNNSAFGFQSLFTNSTGFYNSAFGFTSLSSNTTGYSNSAFGFTSGSSITTGGNNTTIGYNAQVPSGTASNQVRIGNTSVTYAGVQVAWTITSDRKWKENIFPSPLGLSFISKLNPVSYTRLPDGKAGKNDPEHSGAKTEYGLIAQEVEEVLKQEGVENSGMITVTDEGNYELRYNDLLAPMIKSIQELKTENDELKERLAKYELMQNNLAGEIEKMKTKNSDVKEVKLGEK